MALKETVIGSDGIADKGRRLQRSPNYPFISLGKAIERAEQLYRSEQRHPCRLDLAAKHWGYKGRSSGALQTVGALRAFGLLQVDGGTGMDRTVRLTDRALRIVLERRPEERLKALQEAALAPSLYADLWKKWGSTPLSKDNAESYLTIDLQFNPSAAPAVLSAYKTTISFAKLDNSATVPDTEDDNGASEEESVDMPDPQEPTAIAAHRAPSPRSEPSVRGEEEHFRLKLAGGRTARVLFQGDPPTQSEIRKLIANMELMLDQYPEAK